MSADEPDRPFTTDGCSFGLTWVWQRVTGNDPPWQGACIEHDRCYWRGGTRLDRFMADIRLAERVAARGYLHWAASVFLAVRIGGHPLLPFPWRWGYGYKWPRPYD